MSSVRSRPFYVSQIFSKPRIPRRRKVQKILMATTMTPLSLESQWRSYERRALLLDRIQSLRMRFALWPRVWKSLKALSMPRPYAFLKLGAFLFVLSLPHLFKFPYGGSSWSYSHPHKIENHLAHLPTLNSAAKVTSPFSRAPPTPTSLFLVPMILA